MIKASIVPQDIIKNIPPLTTASFFRKNRYLLEVRVNKSVKDDLKLFEDYYTNKLGIEKI